MPATGQAVVIVMPTEEETVLVEIIGDTLSKLAMSWWYMLGWGIVLGGTSLLMLLQLNRRGAYDYFVKVRDEEAAIVAIAASFLLLIILWAVAAYLAYFRKRRRQRIAEVEQLAQDPAVWVTVEKLRRIEEVVGSLKRFNPVLDRLQRPDRFTRHHLAPLLLRS